MPDFTLSDHGSVSIVTPISIEAEEWVRHNIDPDALWFGSGVAVELRYIGDLVEGILCDGLTVG